MALGHDVSISDCEALVAAADRNGSGGVDPEDFLAICTGQL